MERTLSSALLQTHSAASDKSPWPLRVIATITQWQRRIVSRRQLARLDARLLADAGITEDQRYVELQKPFWR